MLHNVNLLLRRTTTYFTIGILLLLSGLLPTPIPSLVPVSEAQSCSAPGYVAFNGRTYYSWIANGLPADASCWNLHNVSVQPTTTCGWSSNAFEFYYGGGISQTFTVPNTEDGAKPNFGLSYLLDFIDPNDDAAWNKFEMYVDDLTTGATLAYDSFNGSMGDLYCSHRSVSWSQNLAGHQIQIRFKGSRGYSNTFIRLRNISLYQNIYPI
jgi:hypothetical protein